MSSQANKITSKEASEEIKAGSIYLDVRTPEEFTAGHAPSAVNVPVAVNSVGGQRQPNPDFMTQVKAAIADPRAQVLVACMGGSRSENAAAQLAQAGYSNVKHMADGFRGWAANNLPVQQQSKG
ncbi:hypothetical protein N2152v2_002837 [Parachlorella kessleri]